MITTLQSFVHTFDPVTAANSQFKPSSYQPLAACVDDNVTDCEIDDPELTSTKKHLMLRATPLSLVDIIRNKYKHFSIIETMEDDSRPNPTYTVTIKLKNPPEGVRPLQGISHEPSK